MVDPYAGFNFALEISGVQAAAFSECTGLQMETKLFEYQEGGNNSTTLRFPVNTTYGNVTLKRGITSSDDLINWHLDVVNSQFSQSRPANTAIVLQDEQGNQVKRWNLIRALPVKWVGPDLKASSSEVAIESLEIAHEGIEIS